jgi:hypothetical protein
MNDAQNQFKLSLLYYPTIRIPSGQWLKQAVLYWDEVGSIVPQDYGGKWLIKDSPDLEYLVGEEQFHPFDPRQLTRQWNLVLELADELKTIIESESYQKFLPPISNRLFDSEIHMDKVSDSVRHYLIEKDLARVKSPDGKSKADWIFFDRTTALLYMSLLAKYLARNDDRSNIIATPGTSRPEYQHLSFGQKQAGDNEVGIEVMIKNWLPIPDPNVPIQDIVVYKRNRQDELLPLQLLMVDFEQQLRKVESVQEAKEVAYKFDLAKRKGLNDLNASLKDANIETKWGNLNTLMGVTAPPLVGFLASKIAEALLVANPVAAGVIAFGLSASIALRAYYVSRQNVVNEKLRNSPYSYLFHAQQEFILPG